jgi:hypothetical protein
MRFILSYQQGRFLFTNKPRHYALAKAAARRANEYATLQTSPL